MPIGQSAWRLTFTGLLICLASALAVVAAPLELTNLFHTGNPSGVWNNDSGGNWFVWTTTKAITDSGTGTGDLFLPSTVNGVPLPMSEGSTTYTLYKEHYSGSTGDGGTTFSFRDGLTTGSLTVTQSPALYSINVGDTVSLVPPTPTLTLNNYVITLSNYQWFSPDVFNRRLAGARSFDTGGGSQTDDVARVTIKVMVPEPASLLLGLGLGAAAWCRRPRR